MKYLLLGGAGFIGTHLAKRLIGQGHEVTIIDSLVTSTKPNFPVKFIHADIRNAVLDEILLETDVVYFLAGSLGVEYIDKNPKSSFENNVGLMNKLIPLFERYNNKVIFTSTSEVYGEGPFSEDNNLSIGCPKKLRWAYAAAKLLTEFAITSSTFPYAIVRLFNVVGPGQVGEYGMVLPKMIKAAKAGTNITVFGDGKQVRSFCHVEDAIDAFQMIEQTNGEIFNLGNDVPITIKELAERVLQLTKSNSEIVYTPYEKVFSKHHADIMYRLPDLTKLRALGFQPKCGLDKIIKDSL